MSHATAATIAQRLKRKRRWPRVGGAGFAATRLSWSRSLSSHRYGRSRRRRRRRSKSLGSRSRRQRCGRPRRLSKSDRSRNSCRGPMYSRWPLHIQSSIRIRSERCELCRPRDFWSRSRRRCSLRNRNHPSRRRSRSRSSSCSSCSRQRRHNRRNRRSRTTLRPWRQRTWRRRTPS